jgi:hypothetical protein
MTSNAGRYPKITPEKQAIIVEGVLSNLPYKFCAWDAGITERTIYNWLERGEREADDGLITDFTEFFHAIKKAEAKKVKEHFNLIDECAERWQARAWALERRWKKDFSAQSYDADKDKTINSLLEIYQAEHKKNEQSS